MRDKVVDSRRLCRAPVASGRAGIAGFALRVAESRRAAAIALLAAIEGGRTVIAWMPWRERSAAASSAGVFTERSSISTLVTEPTS